MEEDINKIISRVLSGQDTKEDKHALDLWLEASEEHQRQYKLLKDTWKSKVPYHRVLNTDEVFDQLWENAVEKDWPINHKSRSH